MIDQHAPAAVALSAQDVSTSPRLGNRGAIRGCPAEAPIDDHERYAVCLMHLPNVRFHDGRKREQVPKGATDRCPARVDDSWAGREYGSGLVQRDQRL